DVQAVAGVVFEVVKVHEGGLGQVVIRQVGVADFGGDDSLSAGRQRRVADGERLVVGEGAGLLLRGECIGAPVHGQHQVGLFDHLFAIQIEIRVVQQQRVLAGSGGGEVPDLVGR